MTYSVFGMTLNLALSISDASLPPTSGQLQI